MRYARSVVAVFVLVLGATTSDAQGYFVLDSRAARQSFFEELVGTRSRAIDAAFPGFIAIAQFQLIVVPLLECSPVATQLACYDAARNTLMFDRDVLAGLDKRLLLAAQDYWMFYERSEARAVFPIIGIIDAALWSAFMNEVAERYDITWPHETCGSVQLAARMGCEMLVSGLDSHLRFRHSRIYNANRVDRLWPDNLTALEQRAWRRNDAEYQEVRDLGGVYLLQPLVKEFGAARVFAYVAHTPFSIEENNVRLSALRYQETARSALLGEDLVSP